MAAQLGKSGRLTIWIMYVCKVSTNKLLSDKEREIIAFKIHTFMNT